jgi:hypothetical protein
VTGGIIQQHTPDLHLKDRYIQDLQAAIPGLLSQELPVPTDQDQVHGLSPFMQDLQAVLQAGHTLAVQVRVQFQDLHQHLRIQGPVLLPADRVPAQIAIPLRAVQVAVIQDQVQAAAIPVRVIQVPAGVIQVQADQARAAAIQNPAVQVQAEAIPHQAAQAAQVQAEAIPHQAAQAAQVQAETIPEAVRVPEVPIQVRALVVQDPAQAAEDGKK